MKSGTDILNRWTNEWTIWDGEDIVQGITDGVLCWLCSSIRGPCGKVHSRAKQTQQHQRRLCANHIIGCNQNNYRVIGLNMNGTHTCSGRGGVVGKWCKRVQVHI